MTGEKVRSVILNEASALVSGTRADDYGDAFINFTNIAQGWEVILGTEVTPAQVALMMGWVKTARLINFPDHRDSWVDLAGYAGLGGEVSAISSGHVRANGDHDDKAFVKFNEEGYGEI